MAAWDNDAVSAGLPNPNALGQQAGQGAGVIPTAAPPAPKLPVAPPVQAAPPVAAAPAPVPDSEEPSWGSQDKTTSAFGAANRGGPDAGQKIIDAEKADVAGNSAKQSAVEAAAGAPVDTQTGLQDFAQRMRLGFISNAVDRAKYLTDKGYEARVISPVGGQPMVVFRKPGAAQWQTIRGSGDVGAGDVGAAVPTAANIATQVGTAIATDGASLPAQVGTQGIVGALSKLFQQGVNRVQGYNSQSLTADAGDAALSGAANAAGELGGQAVSKGIRMVGGEGAHLFNPTNEGQKVLDAAQRLKDYHAATTAPTFGMVGGPLMAAKEQQMSAVSPYLKDAKYDPMAKNLAGLLEKAVADNTGGTAPAISNTKTNVGNIIYPGLDKVLEGMKADAAAPVKAAVPEVAPSMGGKAVQSGIEDLKGALADRKNAKYADQLEAAKGVGFDLSKPQSVADTIMQGIEANGAPKTVTENVPIPTGYSMGNESTYQVPSTKLPLTQIGGLSPQLAGVVADLKSLNPKLFDSLGNGTPAYKPLQSINSHLGYSAGKFPVDGTPKAKAAFAQANELQRALHESLNNPIGEGTNEFLNKTAAAKNSSIFMNRILDHPDMQKAMNAASPEGIMKLASPDNFTFLQQAERTLPPEKFQQFKDAWKTGLINNPDSIPAALTKFAQKDPRVLNILASKDDQKMLSDYADSMANIKGSVAQRMRDVGDFAARPVIGVTNTDGAQIKDLIDRAGGPDSPIGQNLRAAVFQKLMKDGGDPASGMLDMEKVAKSAGGLINSGAMDALLSPQELQRLSDVRTYANSAAQVAGDTQSSMHKGSVAAKFLNPLHPIKSIKNFADIAEAGYQSRTWGSETGRRFLLGEGKPTMQGIRIPAAAAASGYDSQRNQEPQAPQQ